MPKLIFWSLMAMATCEQMFDRISSSLVVNAAWSAYVVYIYIYIYRERERERDVICIYIYIYILVERYDEPEHTALEPKKTPSAPRLSLYHELDESEIDESMHTHPNPIHTSSRVELDTPGLHNKIPAHKIFARVWVAQEPFFS